MHGLTAATSSRRPGQGLRTVSTLGLAAVVVLTGCTDDPPDPGPTVGGPTAIPGEAGSHASSPEEAPSSADVVPSGSPAPTGADSGNGSNSSVQWGSYQNRADACAAVAADVVAMALLPMSLTLGAKEKDVENSEDKIETMEHAAPPELRSDYARVQLILDSFGERLGEGERGGGVDIGTNDGGDDGTGGEESAPASGPSDISSRETPLEPEFDRQGLNEALVPMRDWLTEHCENPPDE